MTKHTCDPGPDDLAVTRGRVNRLLAAYIEGDLQGVLTVARDVSECKETLDEHPRCVSFLLLSLMPYIQSSLPGGQIAEAVAVHLQLEATFDEFQSRNPGSRG